MKKFGGLLALIVVGNVFTVIENDTKYNVYLPLVVNNYTAPMPDIPIPTSFDGNKGIALVTNVLSDLDEVGAGWYYTWSHYPIPTADSRYVPMSYYGLFDSRLPVDYDGFVLFLNEPNNPAPFGSGISPVLAAERYAAFVTARPNAKLIVGNASAWSTAWHYDFIQAIKTYGVPMPKYVGIHGYVESWITPTNLDFYWNQTYLTYKTQGIYPTFWVTEFADTTGDTQSLQALLNVIGSKAWITRYAYFTNRYDPEAEYIPEGWHDFGLFEGGILSPVGEVYRTFP